MEGSPSRLRPRLLAAAAALAALLAAAPPADAFIGACSFSSPALQYACIYPQAKVAVDPWHQTAEATLQLCMGHEEEPVMTVDYTTDGVMVWWRSGIPPGTSTGSEYAGVSHSCARDPPPPPTDLPES